MAFTYDLSTETGQLRLIVGDTAELDALLSDEEIAALLGGGEVDAAVIPALDAMIAKASSKYSWSSGQESEQRGQQAQSLLALRRLLARRYPDPAEELSAEAGASLVMQFQRGGARDTEYGA